MANLKTRNVFIDTESFDAANLNFDSTPLIELIRLAQADFIRVFLTTITVGEVRAHISERIHEGSQNLKRFRKEGRILKNVSACASIFSDFDVKGAIEEVEKKFEEFLAAAKVTVLGLEGSDAESVFKDYFEKKQPFGEGKKKHEFPDAFAQQVLTKWCEKHDSILYVVSRDEDWQSTAEPLMSLVKLQEFINLAVKDQAAELSARALTLLTKYSTKVETAIADAFKDAEFYTEDVDGDVEVVKVTRLKLNEPLVLEVDEETATISVSIHVDYEADVSYLDDEQGIWDDEDHEWSYRPTKYETVEESQNFDAELFLHYDPNNEDSFEVDCSIGKVFRVTVLPTDYELK
jgi:hypothetical protein